MKLLLDGINLEQSMASELIGALQTIIMHPDVVLVTDAKGNHLERVKLFNDKLSDGSVAQTVELHFGS